MWRSRFGSLRISLRLTPNSSWISQNRTSSRSPDSSWWPAKESMIHPVLSSFHCYRCEVESVALILRNCCWCECYCRHLRTEKIKRFTTTWLGLPLKADKAKPISRQQLMHPKIDGWRSASFCLVFFSTTELQAKNKERPFSAICLPVLPVHKGTTVFCPSHQHESNQI